jgi:hypothetical protein
MPISPTDLPRIVTHIFDLIRALERFFDLIRALERFPNGPKPTTIVREARDQLLADLMPSGVDYNILPVGDIVESQLDLKTQKKLEKLLHLLGSRFSPTRKRAKTILWLKKCARKLESKFAPSARHETVPAVDLARKTIKYRRKVHDIESERALRWVKVLAEHPGEWISAPELSNFDCELTGVRTDRLKKFLPRRIRSLIESDRKRGSRLSLP